MGDLFRDKLDASLNMLHNGAEARYDRDAFASLTEKMDVPSERQFVGFDAYQKVIDSGVDLVILACPPHFRPKHFKAAVEAGKHVFMEKPVAVDPAGVRSVLATSELAKKKKLSIVAGTQRRHQSYYLEIMKRIHDGAIGDIVAAQCCWNQGGSDGPGEQPSGTSDMEWQCHNWYHYTWLSGDFIVEQHVHSIDVINWALRAHPIKALGMGGREVRSGNGNIYDHFTVEYEYPNDVRVWSMCRQISGCSHRISQRLIGTKGSAQLDTGVIEGANAYKYKGPYPNPYIQEHIDLIKSIRESKPLNEGRDVAESTMAAIIGRMSAYTGRELKWDWAMNASKLDLSPSKYEFCDLPVRPIAVPDKTRLI